MKPAAFYVLPAVLLISLIACSQPTDPVNDGDDLLNVIWKLDSLQTPAGKDVPTAARHTSIHFTDDMEIRVGQMCRDYDGSYELGADQSLSISLLDSTDVFCHWGEWVTDFETLFAGALRRIESYQTGGDRLTLSSGQNDYLLYFGIEVRDSALANILWKLDTLQTATETFVPIPNVPFVNHVTTAFYDSWCVAGAGPCNYYYGDYDLGKNDSLSVYYVGGFAETGCSVLGEHLQEIFLQAIESADSYSRDGERLILYNQDRSTRLSYSIGAVDEALTKTLYPYWAYYTFVTPRIWRLDSLRTPEGKIIPDPENNLTIWLTQGLAAWIYSDCTRGYGGYFSNLEPGALTFDMGAGYLSPVVCSELDSIFLYALEKVEHYNMNDDKLTLRDSQDDHVLFLTNELSDQ